MSGQHRPDDDVTRYAAAVSAALIDLAPAERAHLLDDLASHLAEVAAESDAPLPERLGPPEVYAAELRGAYGARSRATWLTELSGGLRLLLASGRARLVLGLALVVLAAGTALTVARAVTQEARGEQWSYSQLVDEARAGRVRSVDITGRSAVVIDRTGVRHDVVPLPDSLAPLAQELTGDGVDVSYRQASSGQYWAGILLPNLGLLLLAGAGCLLLYAVTRRRSSANPRAG
jgi:hypothetical protein